MIRTMMPLVIAAALALPLPALAGTGERRVQHEDLDLTSAEGQAALDRRIASAARSVCWEVTPMRTFSAVHRGRCAADVLLSVADQRDAAIAAATTKRGVVIIARREAPGGKRGS